MHHLTKILISITLCYFLTGCASSIKDYQKYVESSPKVATTLKQALEVAYPRKLKIKEEEIWKVTFKDPVLQLGSTKGNFKLFSFSGKKGDQYRLKMWVRCDCLGINKTIMKPIALIIDSNGNIVNNNIQDYKFEFYAGWRPANISGNWLGDFAKDDTYYLVVAADNRNLNQKHGSGDINISPTGYAPISIPLTHYPTGTVETWLSIW